MSKLTLAQQEQKLLAEQDLEEFAKLVLPKRVIGNMHRNLIQWWQRGDATDYQLVLLPRDHGKSAWVALRAAQALTRDPTLRILLISLSLIHISEPTRLLS